MATTAPGPNINPSPTEEWYLEIEELSKTVDQEFIKFEVIGKSLEDALEEHRRIAVHNRDTFFKEFPYPSVKSIFEFMKAVRENQHVDASEEKFRKQAAVYYDFRKKLEDMKETFKKVHPAFKPQHGNHYIAKYSNCATDDFNRMNDLLGRRSPEQIAKLILTPEELAAPKNSSATRVPFTAKDPALFFRIIPCVPSVSRASLPLDYLMRMSRAFVPSPPGSVLYDTHEVAHRIINPTRIATFDQFQNVLATVWVYVPSRGKYLPRVNQQVVNLGHDLSFCGLMKMKIAYVEMEGKDLEKWRGSTAQPASSV
ncbi:hypothetical protein NHQ30_001376 [Ciborinia camelliae]|nr:hypothetical protein NHQ30_001376 [Ciborinia camelliae]